MRDFEKVVESFKDCVREQWEDSTVRRGFKTLKNNCKVIGSILFVIEKANSRMKLSPILEQDVGRNYAPRSSYHLKIVLSNLF